MRSILLPLIATCLMGGQSLAEPNTVQYELQERCGVQARAMFAYDWHGQNITNTKNGQTMADFENHYNSKLNKCSYLLRANTFVTKNGPVSSDISITLVDVNDNRELGRFLQNRDDKEQDKGPPLFCFLGGATCHSKAEWDALIKPYMEN